MASKKIDRNSGDLGKNALRAVRRSSTPQAIWFAAAGISAFVFAGCAADLENPTATYTNAYVTGAGGSASPAGGSGGGGGGGSTVVIPRDPDCWQTVKTQCTGCHFPGGGSLSGGLDLMTANLSERLSKTKALYQGVTNPEKCVPGALLFDPVTPSNSLMLKKVKGTQECGDAMPLSKTATLMGDNLKCFEDWANAFKTTAANVLTPGADDPSDANSP